MVFKEPQQGSMMEHEDEMSTTDGELSTDHANEEVWPIEQRTMSSRTTIMQKPQWKTWKNRHCNDELQNLGDEGQTPEISNMNDSNWIRVFSILDSGASESIAPRVSVDIYEYTHSWGRHLNNSTTHLVAQHCSINGSDAPKL